jgi:hypothetical protein
VLYRKIARRYAFDDFGDIVRASQQEFAKIKIVAYQPAGCGLVLVRLAHKWRFVGVVL